MITSASSDGMRGRCMRALVDMVVGGIHAHPHTWSERQILYKVPTYAHYDYCRREALFTHSEQASSYSETLYYISSIIR